VTQVGVIDLARYYEGDEADKMAVAAELDKACREIGFFALVGHPVDNDLVEATRASVREFFELPLDEKMALKPATSNGRGYVPMEGEALSYTTSFKAPPDAKESFSIGPFAISDEPYYRYEPSGVAFAPNVWPASPSSFSPNMRAYYEAVSGLADDLMELTARAFSLSPQWFVDKSNRPTSALRVLHYPPRPELTKDQFLASPHSDYGTWTILKKRPGLTGLQAQATSGEWLDVIAPAGGFVVNVGDLLTRWTGGNWLSTLHRVVPVDEVEEGGEVSLAFFHQPNWDVVVYPFTDKVVHRSELEGRFDEGSAERHYFGVTVGEFVFGKYKATVSAEALADASQPQ
jgi:isopenicillin N synthase-like dioxygenase